MDACSYNRPFDSQDQIKIRLETEAKLHIQSDVRDGQQSLLLCAVLCLASPGISALASEYEPFVDDEYEISDGVMGGGESERKESGFYLVDAEGNGHRLAG